MGNGKADAMGKHIAMFPMMGKGHLYPTLELCSLLVKRGHKVTCVVDQPWAAIVSEAGATPIPLTLRSSQGFNPPEGLYGAPHDERWANYFASSVFPGFLALATEIISQVSDRYSHDVPDLVIYDHLAYAGRILANRLGVAAVQMYPHFAYFNDCFRRERGICFNPPPMLRFAEQLDFYLWEHGIRTDRNLWHKEALNIYFIPKSFQHHAEHFDDQFCFVGTCLNRPYKRCWTPPRGEKPILLISDSGYRTQQAFLPFITALSGSAYHAVLSCYPEVRFDFLPENFEVNYAASHLEILQHASLAIALGGGAGTILEALYYGVPVLVSPPTPPAEEVAYRVCELGLGASFPRSELTGEMIKWAVEGLLRDPTVRSNILQSRDSFRQSGGAALAADRVEVML